MDTLAVAPMTIACINALVAYSCHCDSALSDEEIVDLLYIHMIDLLGNPLVESPTKLGPE